MPHHTDNFILEKRHIETVNRHISSVEFHAQVFHLQAYFGPTLFPVQRLLYTLLDLNFLPPLQQIILRKSILSLAKLGEQLRARFRRGSGNRAVVQNSGPDQFLIVPVILRVSQFHIVIDRQ